MRRLAPFVAVLVLALTGVACGDKGGAGGGGGLGAAPPKSSDPNSAVGRWTADLGPVKEMMRPMLEMAKSMAAAAAGDAKAKADKGLAEANAKLAELEQARFVLDLFPDGRAVMDMAGLGDAPEQSSGTWTQSGPSVTVTVVTQNGKPYAGRPEDKSKTLTLKDGTLSLSEQGMPFVLVFKR